MQYTKKHRFVLVILPIFLTIIVASLILYETGSVTQSRLFHREGESFGTLAAWALAITIALAGLNATIRRYARIKQAMGKHSDRLKQEYLSWLIRHKTLIIDIHLSIGIVGFIGALVHAYILWSFANVWLILGMALFGWVVLAGLLLKYGNLPPKGRKYLYLLHSQWITVLLLVLATLLGHALIR